MGKIIEFLKTNRKTISPVVSLIVSFFVAYFIEFYKLLGPNNYFEIPIVLLLLLTGVLIGLAMTTTIHQNNPDSFTIEIPLPVKTKESGFKEFKGFLFKITNIVDDHSQVEPIIYCPVCKIKMLERKTLFGRYKFECIVCEKVLKSKSSKRELIEIFISYF